MKRLHTLIFATVAALSVSSAFADNGLTLCKTGIQDQIDITCNGHTSPLPIPAAKSNEKTQCASYVAGKPLPWTGIMMILQNSSGTCVFSENHKTIGQATVTVSESMKGGQLSNLTYDSDDYHLTIDHSGPIKEKSDTYWENINVMITKNNS